MRIVGRKALLRKSFKWNNRTVVAGWFIAEDAFQNERLWPLPRLVLNLAFLPRPAGYTLTRTKHLMWKKWDACGPCRDTESYIEIRTPNPLNSNSSLTLALLAPLIRNVHTECERDEQWRVMVLTSVTWVISVLVSCLISCFLSNSPFQVGRWSFRCTSNDISAR